MGSFMPGCSKSARAAERYAASVVATVLDPLREFPSPTHWPYAARARLTFSGPRPMMMQRGRLMHSSQCEKRLAGELLAAIEPTHIVDDRADKSASGT
jgi:hypothetical protein